MVNRLSTAMEPGRFAFRLEFLAPGDVAGDIERLNLAFAAFLEREGIAAAEAVPLRIGLDELLTNIGKYGPAGLAADALLVAEGEVTAACDCLRLAMADNGAPFDPSAHPPPELDPDPMTRKPGGLGIFMLRGLFHEVRYARENGRNIGVWTVQRRM